MTVPLKNLATNYGLPLGVIVAAILFALPWLRAEHAEKIALKEQNATLLQERRDKAIRDEVLDAVQPVIESAMKEALEKQQTLFRESIAQYITRLESLERSTWTLQQERDAWKIWKEVGDWPDPYDVRRK